MSKASEKKLSALHGAVADVMTAQVLREESETTFDVEGNCVETGETIYTATPALLATAAKFLKDNSITCDVENDENLSSLKDALEKKQRHSRLKSGQSDANSTEVH